MTEENQVTIEQALQMYEQRIQEQTSLIFALVAKFGGKVVLSKEDLVAMPEYNTVAANDADGEGIELVLSYEERSSD